MNKIKKIESTDFTKEDEASLYKKMYDFCVKNKRYIVSSQTIGKPFRAIFLNSPTTKLLMINPSIKLYGEDKVLSQETCEFDKSWKKVRRVKRSRKIEVNTDNHGVVVIDGVDGDKEEMNESTFVQQMLDLLNGITIADSNVNQPHQYDEKMRRNELVITQSPEGIVERIKYKHIEDYIGKGYTIL